MIEGFEAAAEAALFMVGDVRHPLVFSGAAGVMLGATVNSPTKVALLSAAAGAALSQLHPEKHLNGKAMAIAAVTSTALGLVTNQIVKFSKSYENNHPHVDTQKERVDKFINSSRGGHSL